MTASTGACNSAMQRYCTLVIFVRKLRCRKMINCLILPNNAIMDEYSYGVTGDMVEQVRNSCICKNRQWFDSLLEPFFDLYQAEPGFQYAPFYYTYLDSFQRTTTVSINEDVQTVMQLLQYCPD